jgi:hypothetical protein
LCPTRALCGKALAEALEVSNASWLYEIASRFDAEPLRQAALHFIMRHWTNVAATFDAAAEPGSSAIAELRQLRAAIFGPPC